MRPLSLAEAEKSDLIAFLESLSGTEVIVEAPELPPYGLLDFRMRGQW